MYYINNWLTANKLSFNVEKCQYTIFSPTTTEIDFNSSQLSLFIGSNKLTYAKTVKYLGILIDCSLTWIDHIQHIYNKIKKLVGIFYKIRQYIL